MPKGQGPRSQYQRYLPYSASHIKHDPDSPFRRSVWAQTFWTVWWRYIFQALLMLVWKHLSVRFCIRQLSISIVKYMKQITYKRFNLLYAGARFKYKHLINKLCINIYKNISKGCMIYRYKNNILKRRVVAHVCDPKTWETVCKDQEFAICGHAVSLGIACNTWDPPSKRQQKSSRRNLSFVH